MKLDNKKIIEDCVDDLYDYQIDIVNQIYNKNFFGVINIFCALGKSYLLTYLLKNHIKNKLVLICFNSDEVIDTFVKSMDNN